MKLVKLLLALFPHAAWGATNATICVLGGTHDDTLPAGGPLNKELNATECYDGSTWVSKAASPTPHSRVQAAMFGGKACLVGGAIEQTEAAVSSVECYSFETDSWSTLPNLPYAAKYMATVSYQNGIITTGGSQPGNALSSVSFFDGVNWVSKAPMQQSRYVHTAATIGTALAVAGGTGPPPDYDRLSSVEYFQSGTWTYKTPLPFPTIKLGSAVFQSKFCVVGGQRDGDNKTDRLLSSAHCFDGTTWNAIAPLPVPRLSLSVSVFNGNLCSVGGYTYDGEPGDEDADYLYDFDCFDGSAWVSKSGLILARARHAVGVFGGPVETVKNPCKSCTIILIVSKSAKKYAKCKAKCLLSIKVKG